MMLTPSSIQIAWLSLVKWPILRLDTAITKCLIKNIKIHLTLVFQWPSENMCRFDKKIGLPLKMQIFTNHFVFRRQPTDFFFSKKMCQMKAGQNNKYDITKTWGFVQVCFQILNIIKNLYSILLFSALMIQISASSFLPEDFRESLSIVKDSIMYSDNCEQFVCWRNMSLLLKNNYEL